jgi:hypothetical protein
MFLMCSKGKNIEKKKKKEKSSWNKKFFQMFLKWKKIIHCYIKLKCEQHCNATWIEFEFYIRYNWIEFKFLIWILIFWTEYELNWISIQLSN